MPVTRFGSLVPVVAALLFAAGVASAQGAPIDKGEIRFVSKQLGANVEGRFRAWKANVDFRPADPARSKAELEVDLASIDLASADSEEEVRRPRWFDTARFPVATFASTSVRASGAGKYEVTGRLSLKGVTRDVVVPISITRDASGNSVAQGEFTVNRLDFKVGDGQWADPDVVANEVKVRVRMVLPPAS
jgi:polyisoprenoid-binding protein YceI